MKRLFLTLMSVSSLIVAQPWNSNAPTLPSRDTTGMTQLNIPNNTNKLPQKDKDKLDMLLLSTQGLEGNNPSSNYEKMFNENWTELREQIERASSGMSLSGWTSSLSKKDRIAAIRDAVKYILYQHVNAGTYTPAVRQYLINDLSELISFANLKLSKL